MSVLPRRPDVTEPEEPTSDIAVSRSDRFEVLLWILGGILLLVTAAALWAAQALFIPIVVGLLLSYALQPVQRAFTRIGLPTTAAAAVTVLATTTLIGVAGYSLRLQAVSFLSELPDAAARIRARIQQSASSQPSAMVQVKRAAHELEQAAEDRSVPDTSPSVTRVQVEPPSSLSTNQLLWTTSTRAMTLAGQIVVVVVLAFYFLAAGDMYKRKIVRIAGTTLSEKRVTVEILQDIERHLARYAATRATISLVVAVATGLVLWALGMHQPAVWGGVAGLLNVIPYFGPIAFSIAAGAAGFVTTNSATHAAVVFGAASAIAMAEGFLLTPLLMGRAGRMNGASVFVALTVWGFLWGLWGMLLAVPLTMMIKVICEHIDGLYFLSELLSEEP
jgi:predicted PurR-regulated permease PerM